jgi:hypothetical protein
MNKNNFNFPLKSLKLSNCFILVGILLYNLIPMFMTLLLKSDVWSSVKCIQYDVKHNLVLDGILVY